MADFNNTNLADFSGVWVFCEQRQGKLQPTVLELISEARKLADDMGTEVCGLLLGGKGVADSMLQHSPFSVFARASSSNARTCGFQI